MSKTRFLVVAAVTLMTFGLTATPAYADDATVYTNDYPFPWAGHTQWWGYGDRFEVCDTEGDGKRVVGGFYYRAPGSSVWVVGPTAEAVGKGDCAGGSRDIPESSIVQIWVCTKDGPNAEPWQCDNENTTADNS